MHPSARSLLISLSILTFFVPGLASAQCWTRSQACSTPASYTQSTTVSSGNLLVTLATDRNAYVIGTPVHIWLSFQNTGSTPLTIPNPSGIDPMHLVVILPATCDSLTEAGCLDKWYYQCPGFFFFFGGPVTLNPGQCFSHETTWDGQPDPHMSPMTPGLHQVFGGMTNGMGKFHAPPGGVRLPIQIQASSTVPVTPASWGVMKSRYR